MLGFTPDGKATGFEKPLKDNEHMNSAYSKFIIALQVGTLITVPVFGYFADTMDLRYPIPASFLARALVLFSFPAIQDPEGAGAYIAAFFLTATTAV